MDNVLLDLPMIIAQIKGLLIKHSECTPDNLEHATIASLLAHLDDLLGRRQPAENSVTAAYEELRTLRSHAIALYETMTSIQWNPDDNTSTDGLLQHLTNTSRQLLDNNNNQRLGALREAETLQRKLFNMAKRFDRVVKHLGDALSTYALGPDDDIGPVPMTERRNEGRQEPPTSSAGSPFPG
jgi:hypothetical protein